MLQGVCKKTEIYQLLLKMDICHDLPRINHTSAQWQSLMKRTTRSRCLKIQNTLEHQKGAILLEDCSHRGASVNVDQSTSASA